MFVCIFLSGLKVGFQRFKFEVKSSVETILVGITICALGFMCVLSAVRLKLAESYEYLQYNTSMLHLDCTPCVFYPALNCYPTQGSKQFMVFVLNFFLNFLIYKISIIPHLFHHFSHTLYTQSLNQR